MMQAAQPSDSPVQDSPVMVVEEKNYESEPVPEIPQGEVVAQPSEVASPPKYEHVSSEPSSAASSVKSPEKSARRHGAGGRSKSEKQMMVATNAKENWRMVLMSRSTFIKHGRLGKPKNRKVLVNTTTGDVSWGGEFKGLNVKNLVTLTKGKANGRPFLRDWAFQVDADLCFTLHFTTRDVCLQAATVKQRDSFCEAILACSEYLKNTKHASSKYGSRKHKKEEENVELKQGEQGVVDGGVVNTTTVDPEVMLSNKPQVVKKVVDDAEAREQLAQLPDRAMSKHMQKVRRAHTEKNLS